jgi:hypothetical protein
LFNNTYTTNTGVDNTAGDDSSLPSSYIDNSNGLNFAQIQANDGQ